LTVNRSHPVYPDQRTFREKSARRKGATTDMLASVSQ
jgi:hypothetical protein